MIHKFLVHLTFEEGVGRFELFATCLPWHAISATLKRRTGARQVIILCEVPILGQRALGR